MFATGNLHDYPVQVYSGTQSIVADEARRPRSHANDDQGIDSPLFLIALSAAICGDTVVLPVTVPLTLVNPFLRASGRDNFACARTISRSDPERRWSG